ncbi:MAG TPA: DUF559 domain-containing protein [Allosphingosinicella sp.]|nr:DUF559 domain-containing protein [Allosphingosinicella sp.]
MLKDIAPKGGGRAVRKARALRRDMSILDFFCSDARLAIEVDGKMHESADRLARDNARDRWFQKAGIKTMRLPAAAVLGDAEAVLRSIIEEAQAELPLHHPALPGGPPPRDELGED